MQFSRFYWPRCIGTLQRRKQRAPTFSNREQGPSKTHVELLGGIDMDPVLRPRLPTPEHTLIYSHGPPLSHLIFPYWLPSGHGTALIQGPEDLSGPPRVTHPGLPPAPPRALFTPPGKPGLPAAPFPPLLGPKQEDCKLLYHAREATQPSVARILLSPSTAAFTFTI